MYMLLLLLLLSLYNCESKSKSKLKSKCCKNYIVPLTKYIVSPVLKTVDFKDVDINFGSPSTPLLPLLSSNLKIFNFSSDSLVTLFLF